MAFRPEGRGVGATGRQILSGQCVSLWIGDSLGPVERACLRSVMRQGHPLALYCYERPAGLPDGIEVRDAEAVIPRERIIRHKSGSPALFANRFRYELQRRCAGIWVDCDIYLLAPLPIDEVYLMGEESPGTINNGVLRLPSDSPLLPPLLALFEEKEVPWWLPWRARMAAHARLRWTGRTNLGAMRGEAPDRPRCLHWPGSMDFMTGRYRARSCIQSIGRKRSGSSIPPSVWRSGCRLAPFRSTCSTNGSGASRTSRLPRAASSRAFRTRALADRLMTLRADPGLPIRDLRPLICLKMVTPTGLEPVFSP